MLSKAKGLVVAPRPRAGGGREAVRDDARRLAEIELAQDSWNDLKIVISYIKLVINTLNIKLFQGKVCYFKVI